MADDKPIAAATPKKCCRLTQLLLCLVVFVSGGIVGIGLTVIFPDMTDFLKPDRPDWSKMNAEQKADYYLDRISRDLDLTDAQKAQLKPGVMKRMQMFEDAMKPVRPIMMKLLKDMDEDIRPILTADQIEAWEKYCRKRAQRYSRPTGTQPAAAPKSP